MTEHRNLGARAGRTTSLIVGGVCLGVVGLVMSCTPAAPGGTEMPPANATVQAAATQIGGATGAVATAQTGVMQPTVSSAQTQIVGAGQGVGTAVAPTVEAARTEVAPTVAAARTELAPTVEAARTQLPSTVEAARTQMAPTVAAASTAVAVREATATVLAPTAQAAATHVAPTVQAAATQAVTTVGTSVALSPVHVTSVSVSQDDTSVVIQNTGSGSMNLAGWTLVMGPNFSMVLGDITINAGQTRTLHLSQGTDTPSDVYLGFGSSAARGSLQPGSRVVLIAPPDQVASIYSIT
jgi:hypothetical protein